MSMEAASGAFVRLYGAVPASISDARAELATLAAHAGASQEELERICLAASEALTNVVEHAYCGVGGQIEVLAGVAGGDLSVLVADRGSGLRRDHRSEGLGLGFVLMRMSCDALTLAPRSGGGLEVRMRFAIAALRERRAAAQARGSVASASLAASPSFSTTM
jgi:anti-sigma regulatory factor (Ser/Thr protein kinase)